MENTIMSDTYAALMALLKKRRSIRRFKPDPVPEDVILKIIEAGRLVPSGFNMQPWEFVVVTDADLRAKIAGYLSFYWQQSKEMEKARPEWQGRSWQLTGMIDVKGDYSIAPVYILLLGDPRTQAGLPMGVQCDRNRRRIIYLSSLANAFLQMHLAAAALGLASQWISAVQTPYSSCMIKELLGIPPLYEVYDMVALGWPSLKPPAKFMRATDKMVHWNRSGESDFRTEDEVNTFIKKARSWTIGTHSRDAEDV
jgi:nitroreductase